MRIRDLKGFGPKSEEILAEVGIISIYAIIGAREGIHWQEVAKTRKEEILYKLDDMGLAPK